MKIVSPEKLKQFLKENTVTDMPKNVPDLYRTKGWNMAMTAIYKKVDEMTEEIDGI